MAGAQLRQQLHFLASAFRYNQPVTTGDTGQNLSKIAENLFWNRQEKIDKLLVYELQ